MQLVFARKQQFQASCNVGYTRAANQRLVGKSNAVIADCVAQLRSLLAYLDPQPATPSSETVLERVFQDRLQQQAWYLQRFDSGVDFDLKSELPAEALRHHG